MAIPGPVDPARAILVVYASGLDRIGPSNELHTDFRLDAAGETVTLSDPIGRTVDQVVVPRLGPNESLGRPPNPESGEWTVYSKLLATPGSANGVVSVGPPLPPPVFSVDSGFHAAGAEVVLELRGSPTNALIRYTTNGDPVTVVSPTWTGPLRIQRSQVVRAKAYLEARSSAESLRSYFSGSRMICPSFHWRRWPRTSTSKTAISLAWAPVC